MQINELKITNWHEGKYGDVSFRVFVKAEDVTPELNDFLKYHWRDGTSLCGVLKEFQNENESAFLQKPTLKGKGSIYQRFRIFCGETGVDYEKEKEKLTPIGITTLAHLLDLEKYMPTGQAEELIMNRLWELKQQQGLLDQQ